MYDEKMCIVNTGKKARKKRKQEERFAAVLLLRYSVFALDCQELTEAALLLIWHQQLTLPFQQQLCQARSAPGPLTCFRKAEGC